MSFTIMSTRKAMGAAENPATHKIQCCLHTGIFAKLHPIWELTDRGQISYIYPFKVPQDQVYSLDICQIDI